MQVDRNHDSRRIAPELLNTVKIPLKSDRLIVWDSLVYQTDCICNLWLGVFKMRIIRVLAAAALGLGLMGMSAQASTVQTGVVGALPTVGLSGSDAGSCGAGIADCFVMPIDQEVGIVEGFTFVDNGAFSTTFQFRTTVDLGYNFSFSVNEPTDFSGLNFSILDALSATVFSLTPGQVTGGMFAFAMLASELYTLVVSGDVSLASGFGANYTLQVSAVPIPGAAWLFGTALLGGGIVVGRRRRRRTTIAAPAV